MKVRCIIKDARSQWEEALNVKHKSTAEAEIKLIVQNFNRTLRPGELPRAFVKLVPVMKPPKVKGKKIEAWYIEPDKMNPDWFQNYLNRHKIADKVDFKHYQIYLDEAIKLEGTPEIIFIDTGAITGGTCFGGCSPSMTFTLKDFLGKHRSSYIVIVSYVRIWAEDYLEQIKEHMSNEDLFVDIGDNGAEEIVDYIANKIKGRRK